MKLQAAACASLSLMILGALSSCQQRNRAMDAGLQARAAGGCDPVRYTSPMRMFTAAGEIADPAVIEAYRACHGLGGEAPLVPTHPDNILSSSAQRVFFNGVSAAGAAGPDEVVIMRQQDTGMVGVGRDQGTIDAQFAAEQAFLRLRKQLLRMEGDLTELQQVDDQNYRLRECYHVKGARQDAAIRLPYTFIATRSRLGSYPYALKAGVVPAVAPGDTVLVREGFLALR